MAYKSNTFDLAGFFADLVRCETRLYNALNDRLRARHGIVTSQFEALCYLRDHPGCRVADLAAEFAIGVGAASKSVDRLQKQGWAARQPNPADGRSPLLVLTDDGSRLVDAAEETFTEGLSELLGTVLHGPSATAAAQVLAALRAALERDRTGTPTG
ncbi:MarR family winged helix-turn-helix transcriptional regulator [Streptomyces sp. TG1A-8]|uniref:MarR family winged helix-turn-helix transcriptional regulator n=1 Tax=Streptomyces sp. TG1A-8 TaxID=3051385 RepID=UPI00265C7592|nr:MarR family winged helix-turn-helix transcriptional regulator [Streptomyces sp. TG1A-8]MDO0924071.1 MarR family winged helix-turn-helix transcriptional regulator [Streptomyces sp. TG1A-8]